MGNSSSSSITTPTIITTNPNPKNRPFGGSPITMFGAFILSIYGIMQITAFYGYDQTAYMNYIIFYAIVLVSTFILPKWDPDI